MSGMFRAGAWAKFPCNGCGEQLDQGDEVVMVPINPMQSHPAHVRCLDRENERD